MITVLCATGAESEMDEVSQPAFRPQDISYQSTGGVAWITLRRPQKLNALTWSSIGELEHAFGIAEEDEAVRVIVIAGEGRGFCSGLDLGANVPQPDDHPRPGSARAGTLRSRHLYVSRVYNCRKPVIAAVNGVAAGTGMSLALACDIRILSADASFCAAFVKRAAVADTGSSWLLPRVIGSERALRMLWTGRIVSAEEAVQIGLASELVAPDRLRDRVQEVASELARGPSLAIEFDKQLVRQAFHRSLEDQVQLEEYFLQTTRASHDAAEGLASFREKRDPVFEGR